MFAWIKQVLNSRKQGLKPVPFEHGIFGTLTFQDEGWWSGAYTTPWGDIEINITGDLVEPDKIEMMALVERLSSYRELRDEAMRFLANEASKAGLDVSGFAVTAIDHLWTHGGRHFFVDFSHPDDPHAIWRVEYVEGCPKYVSCDR